MGEIPVLQDKKQVRGKETAEIQMIEICFYCRGNKSGSQALMEGFVISLIFV